MKALESRKATKLEPIAKSVNVQKEGAFARKNTERKKPNAPIESVPKTKESHRTATGAVDDELAKKQR